MSATTRVAALNAAKELRYHDAEGLIRIASSIHEWLLQDDADEHREFCEGLAQAIEGDASFFKTTTKFLREHPAKKAVKP